MRMSEQLNISPKSTPNAKGQKPAATASQSRKQPVVPANRTIQLADLVPTVKHVEKPQKDFFGRIVKPKLTDNAAKVAKEPALPPALEAPVPQTAKVGGWKVIKDPGIIFKFNEGYSNAVRKPFLMRDLLK